MFMEYRKNIWFSPRKILARYEEKKKELGSKIESSKFKILNEAKSVAIMLLGIQKIQSREYWLQLVDPKEQTPDIRTATHLKELSNFPLTYQDVEVVTLEKHSNEDIESFLKRTKLSESKSYQEDTIILCVVNKNIQTKSWKEISKSLGQIKNNVVVYILGRTDPIDPKYQIACVYPSFTHAIKFDVQEEVLKPARDTMQFKRSTKRSEQKSTENFEPF